jgi:hypothetical protein
MRSDVHQVAGALAEIRTALQADGYDLMLTADDSGRITLEVKAGPNACADCLIPKDVFVSIVAHAIGDGTGQAGERDLSIIYPGER